MPVGFDLIDDGHVRPKASKQGIGIASKAKTGNRQKGIAQGVGRIGDRKERRQENQDKFRDFLILRFCRHCFVLFIVSG